MVKFGLATNAGYVLVNPEQVSSVHSTAERETTTIVMTNGRTFDVHAELSDVQSKLVSE